MMHSQKSGVIEGYQQHAGDTGSIEVQIALLTARIKHLTEHFKKHAKDFGSKRGLLIMVGRRRRFLKYLQEKNEEKYKEMVERLGLRR